MRGCRRHACASGVWPLSGDQISCNWQLPHAGIRGRPPGALKRYRRCRRDGAGRKRGISGGCGGMEAASGFVHPVLSTPMLENWRWSVCRPETWGAPGRRLASPLPAAGRARQAAAAGLWARASRRRGLRVTSADGCGHITAFGRARRSRRARCRVSASGHSVASAPRRGAGPPRARARSTVPGAIRIHQGVARRGRVIEEALRATGSCRDGGGALWPYARG